MNRHGLLIATLLALLLTSLVLAHNSSVADPRSSKLHDTIPEGTVLRYRQAQPSHWRAFLLQH
jgi:hypothetical protein